MSSSTPLALIVPYRDRQEHLGLFVPHISRFLEAAGLAHVITVVEQHNSKPFNRGLLLNAGFALSRHRAGYFCFHDVDLLPLHEDCDYSRPQQPTHLARYVSQFGFKILHPGLFGGVNLFTRRQFTAVNGFSNGYWGWGGEDNDLLHRCKQRRFEIIRKAGRYRSLGHPPNDPMLTGERSRQQIANERRWQAVMAGELDWRSDGLADLRFAVRSHCALGHGARLISIEF